MKKEVINWEDFEKILCLLCQELKLTSKFLLDKSKCL